jgi:hypothetical protein
MLLKNTDKQVPEQRVPKFILTRSKPAVAGFQNQQTV